MRASAIILFIWRIWGMNGGTKKIKRYHGKLGKVEKSYNNTVTKGCGVNYTGVEFSNKEEDPLKAQLSEDRIIMLMALFLLLI